MGGMSNYNVEDKYVPGVCNIGKREIKKEKTGGMGRVSHHSDSPGSAYIF